MGSRDIDFRENELMAARASFCVAQDRWLITDPLRFLGAEPSAESLRRAVSGPDTAVEVDIVTKPKPGGGVRAELFPDLASSVILQLVADRVAETLTEPSDSLSIRLFGVRLQGENPYDVWGSGVAAWLRSELEAGRVVFVCDLRNYFPSIRRDQIESALVGRVADRLVAHALRVLDAIHADCKDQGRPIAGLPVSPADFFWLVADLVLSPLDRDIRSSPAVMGYVRWVDDLFVSTSSSQLDQVIKQTEAAADHSGFRLNHEKTRVLRSREEFRTAFRVAEHEMLSHLFSTLDHGHRTPRVETLIHNLHRDVLGGDIEDARLIKRMYGLATLIGSPILVESAAADLARFPTAEMAILDYLSGQAWPEGSEATAITAIESAATDSRAVLALRSLLNSSLAGGHRSLLDRLEHWALDGNNAVHPYARAVMAAVLAKNSAPDFFAVFAEKLVAPVETWKSSLARRVAYEFLILASGAHLWQPRLAADSSSLIRELGRLLSGAATDGERASLRAFAEHRRPRRLAWGDLEPRLARKLIAAGPT